ncbi:beta-hexosaminidase subunit alpha-like [Megalops cyprinoides]|uniref:beta-hexosaminidase subunit alpha-like n=1 Tax=Megalops cyprinoides TaxID=118141 RepID=UPI00186550B7|nr:beta-hexosaminidase subunit alpha-like [Megalops cyprinoides]
MNARFEMIASTSYMIKESLIHVFLWLSFVYLITLPGLPVTEGVWPMPQTISQFDERYSINPQEFTFRYAKNSVAQPGCSVLDTAFRRYFSFMFPGYTAGKDSGTDNPGRHSWPDEDLFSVVVRVREGGCEGYPHADSRENYNLSVSAYRGVLTAETVWGALRGLESFSQLVYQDDHNTFYVNKTEIWDFPRFQHRGVLLDTSRHFLPVKTILKTLEAMSYSKFNVFHWHIVDDPSFPFQSLYFPDLSNKGAFHPRTHVYTRTDVRQVISHARLHGIRVLPEFDSPGHTQSWGKGYPNLLTPCYHGGSPDGRFGPVNAAAGYSYKFMARLFKEVRDVFPDRYVHLGGDEVDSTCWKSNPDVRVFMSKMGFGSDFTKLESFYMENIVNMTAALNKTAIVWQDVFDYQERPRTLSVVEVWKGGCYLCEVRKVTRAGIRAILASPWYLDQPGPTHDWSRYYNVRPLAFTGSEQQKQLVIGGEVCLWGEYVDAANLSPLLWPRASAIAERLWSDEEQTSSVTRAFPRLAEFRCRLLRRGVRAGPLAVGHCREEYQDV